MTEPAPRRPARLSRWLAVALLALLALPGCTAMAPHGDELYASARQANLLFKEAVAALLVHVSDGTWQVQEYGDIPVDCRDGYAFSLHRTTYEGWTTDADAPTTADRLGEWLIARGWTTRPPAQHADGEVVVEASDPSLDVATLTIEIRGGAGRADAIGVGATSTCFDGDPAELTAILYPGWPDHPVAHEPLPVGELAGATPIFGFTEDGEPR
ncbi:hypothetical protein ACFVSU_09490 [Microbacterium sp. NPDC058062]|uniref:hypothetical protein n=1 Tax=Microbacterium sp. NPDC058062 TaxID=3346320 RepID=UPI0036DE8497